MPIIHRRTLAQFDLKMSPFKNIVVFDVDGTLADCSNRVRHLRTKPKRWDRFFAEMASDAPIVPLVEVCRSLHASEYRIILLTGRYEQHRSITEKWLERHSVPYHELRMRRDGDKRQDTEAKREMLADSEVDQVLMIFEDRTQMVGLWRSLGITCLQVDEGDF